MRYQALMPLALLVGACTVVPSAGPQSSSAPKPAPTKTDAIKPSVPTASVPRAPSSPSSSGSAGTATSGATTAAGETAIIRGVQAGPSVASLGLSPQQARSALAAFRISCPSVQRREDKSGLTQSSDWVESCAAATSVTDDGALGFFQTYFDSVIVGDGAAHATGYYEPEIAGSRTQGPGFAVPVYRRPADLIDVDLGKFSDAMKGKSVRGRVKGTQFIPYFERSEIITGALSGQGLELAWAADPVEFFFLQIQGSGRLRLPDGSVMRIGYDGQNGRDYVGIGGMLRNQGVLQPGEASMQGIMGYLRRQPDGGQSVMNANKSFVFFRELTGPGPIGALGVPVTGNVTVAADPAFTPLGAPVFLTVDRTEANGLWIAQDTGGAIKGSNRFDTFWGAGDQARVTAGGMSARGKAWLLLPKISVARLTASGANGRSTP